jgi:alkylation response protein AidB-like acyl-CoA dehydrogenase
VVSDLIRRYGTPELQARFLPKLEHPDWDQGWRGTIWFTENETGGSDLGSLQTTARFDGKHWRLRGLKWFCSIADADLIMTIARPEGAPAGTRGLCLFLLPRWLDDNREQRNSYTQRRLKAKLGCRSVPSAETELHDAVAYPCCGLDGHPLDGKGLARAMTLISPMQRFGVSIMGEGITRRVFLSAYTYASQRKVFGRLLTDHPMMQDTLLLLMSETEACASFMMKLAAVLSKATPLPAFEDQLQRILTPMAKQRFCRRGVDMASIALEVFGGNGFIEDWPMERQLRDSQNHPMWEGTEIVLSMDVLRAGPAAFASLRQYFESVQLSLASSAHSFHLALGQLLAQELRHLPATLSAQDAAALLPQAHRFSNMLADLVQYTTLCEQALWAGKHESQHRSAVLAAYFAQRHLLARSDRWACLRAGGFPKMRSLFHLLTSHAVVRSEQASPAVAELLGQPRSSL